MKENQHNIFSTPIWGFVFNDHKYQMFNYIEKIRQIEQTELSAKKSNFGGYQTRDNLNEEPVFKEFVSMINSISNKIVSEFNFGQCLVEVKEMWGNINYKNCYNGNHTHGGILSGVVYAQVPKNSGKLILCNPAVRSDGHLIRNSLFEIQPEPLACIIFPSWLEHFVEPNMSDEDRISISFNVGVK